MVHAKEWCENILNRILSESKSYHGHSLTGLRPLFQVEGGRDSATIYAPYWVDALQRGRGARKSNKTTWSNLNGYEMSALQLALYRWMEKHNSFRSSTEKGKINDAKSLAFYINKYGTKQYREGKYIDIYDTIIKQAAEQLYEDVGREAVRITSNAVFL